MSHVTYAVNAQIRGNCRAQRARLQVEGMEDIATAFREKDRFAAFVGIELVELRAGYALATMAVQAHHFNGVGMVHGGAMFALADFAFAAASNSHGLAAVGIQVNVAYLKAVQQCVLLRAEAKEESCNKKLGQYTVRITDPEGDLVALMTGMVYRKPVALLDVVQ